MFLFIKGHSQFSLLGHILGRHISQDIYPLYNNEEHIIKHIHFQHFRTESRTNKLLFATKMSVAACYFFNKKQRGIINTIVL